MKKAAPWVFILILAGGFTAWYFSQSPAPEAHPSIVALPMAGEAEPRPGPRAQFPVPAEEPETSVQPEALPVLEQSDEAVIEALSGLLGAEELGSVFILEQIVSRIVSTVDSLDSRQIAPLVMPVKPAGGKFMVQGNESPVIHPDNAARYQRYANVIQAMDAESAMSIYRRYYPLFQEAYEQLGYQDRYFNDRLVEIVDHLLATPATPADIEVIQSESVYVFVDQRMEDLSAGQKILLRVSREQRRVAEQKLGELRGLLAQASQ